MAEQEFYDSFWLGVGTLIVSLGGSTAALASFRGDFVSSYSGILLFIFGYKLSWYGVHRDYQDELQGHIEKLSDPSVNELAVQVAMFVIGGLGITIGLYMFAQAAIQGGLVAGFVAGTVSFIGYLVAHTQINDALV